MTRMTVFRNSAPPLEPLALAGTPEVDPREDHGHLRRLEFDADGVGGAGNLESSGLESFVPDDRDPEQFGVDGSG